MASLTFNDFDLNQTCITGRRKPDVTLDSFRRRYKIDKDTKQRTEETDGFVADIIARNRIQSVKLPENAVTTETIQQIQDALAEHKIVTVNFGVNASTLRGRCYALINPSGQLVRGVSCTASEMNIVSITEPETDDFDELDDIEL